ncbi:phospholipase [Actinokineospora guangxiensis]|uniref:Phospholipase n=1 Tax=Actinokineospora guangxiensis TaxID=1490288 RepID=A0ABW0ENL2_9PSEU
MRLRVAWLLLIVLVAGAYAVVASRPPRPPQTVAASPVTAAVDALLDPRPDRDPTALIPADFTAVTGVAYRLRTAPDGTLRAINPEGGCSAPWGDTATRWDYTVGCQAHDLGYDLLRYAAATGVPVDAERRRALDERLSLDMHAQCALNPRDSAGLCQVVASLFTVGLVVNSWHQSWGPPASEPMGVWGLVLAMVVVLLAVRLPVFRRRPRPAPRPPPAPVEGAAYVSLVGVGALAGLVLAETALAFAPPAAGPVSALWPMTWALQLVPLFFFACGHCTLHAWRAGGGYGRYLAGRLCWLIRPVFALVTAWLAVPLSLELFGAPPEVATAFGRLVAQPLWLLGLSLVVVAAVPLLHVLHRAAGTGAAAFWLVLVLALELLGPGTLTDYAAGVALALLFAQLAHAYADGVLWRVPRPVLVGVAVSALGALAATTALGWVDPMLIAEPAGTPSFVPSAAGVLLLGLAQVAVVALPRVRRVGAAAERAVRIVRTAPMTVYLGYLCAALLVAGMVTAVAGPGVPAAWLTRPSTLLAIGLVAVPAVLGFLLFEWKSAPEGGFADGLSRWDGVAAALGVAYAALGVIGFAAGPGSAVLGLPLDPMAGIIHLLLGWYLLHSVRVGTSSLPGPWLLAALACVPAALARPSAAGFALHGATVALAAVAAAACGARRKPQVADRADASVCQASGQPEGA